MDAETLFRRLGEVLDESMPKHKVPGVAVGILSDGQEFTRGFGVTSVDNPLPVDENTLFQIGSNTKTYTGTAMMRLVEEGKLNLDEPIRTYLPNFRMRDPEVTAHLTMRHLLTHTGGFVGDYFEDTGNGDDALEKFVAAMASLEQLTPLGSEFSYCNSGFSLAGRVIEAVKGMAYEQAMLELVLKPLGLKRSYFFPTDVMLHRFAVGHTRIEDKNYVLRPWQLPRSVGPAGGITASIKDLLKYGRFHLGDGAAENATRVLSAESMRAMQTPGTVGELDMKMGLAWRVAEKDGPKRIFHGGGTYGHISSFFLYPGIKFGFAMMTNSLAPGDLFRDIDVPLREFLGMPYKMPEPIRMAPEALASYEGHYVAALDDVDLQVENSDLMMQVTPKGGFPNKKVPVPPPPPPAKIGFITKDRICVVDGKRNDICGEFLRDAGGKVAHFRMGGRIHPRR
jgi:CubicO group peptidase (beta-lactamase class C family)